MTTPTWTTLAHAETLAQALGSDDLVVIDTRFSLAAPDAGERAYRESHIPGARYAHLDRDLSNADAKVQGAGRHPWPDAASFAARLGAWGVTPATQVVAYDDGDGAYAARLWFLLQAFGHVRAAVLDGGWVRWTLLGLPVQADSPSLQPTGYVAHFDASRLLDAAQVQAHLDHGGLLVDARAGERFRGEVEPIDRSAGHVPGAVNRPYAMNLVDGRFKPSAQLAQEFGALLGAHTPETVVAMCGSGVTACHHLLAMAHAGLHGAKLYTGSWSGWIEDPTHPVATGPL
jgi:thiosulfate/3-mercaptopyruvate sulfurtransferase